MSNILVQITIYDEDSKQVTQQFVHHYDGCYGFEIRDMFDKLGDKISTIIDPRGNEP